MLSVIAAQNRNSPAQVVQKCARRLIDGTQCFHCDRLENCDESALCNAAYLASLREAAIYYYYFFIYYLMPTSTKPMGVNIKEKCLVLRKLR